MRSPSPGWSPRTPNSRLSPRRPRPDGRRTWPVPPSTPAVSPAPCAPRRWCGQASPGSSSPRRNRTSTPSSADIRASPCAAPRWSAPLTCRSRSRARIWMTKHWRPFVDTSKSGSGHHDSCTRSFRAGRRRGVRRPPRRRPGSGDRRTASGRSAHSDGDEEVADSLTDLRASEIQFVGAVGDDEHQPQRHRIHHRSGRRVDLPGLGRNPNIHDAREPG